MKNNITMKIILTLVIAFGIQISGLIANNIGEVVNTNSPITLTSLAPTVPMEANFVEMTEFDFTMNLIPDVPTEAEFDNSIEVELLVNSFAPVLPMQADFDNGIEVELAANSFSPVVPLVADYTDKL
mgnify:CR=1 FL=1